MRKTKAGKKAQAKEWQDAAICKDISNANRGRGTAFEVEALKFSNAALRKIKSLRRGWT